MLNLVSRNNASTLFLIAILSGSLISSCRKKIEHTPSSSTPAVRWRLVKSLGYNITSVEEFNNELYIAGLKWGEYYNIPTLEKLDANYNLINFQNGTFSKVYSGGDYEDPRIYQLYATSDKLYIGGSYKFNLNGATSLMYYDLNGNFTPIQLLTHSSCYISSFCEFQNTMIVGGYFGTYDPLVTTANTERIQNDIAIGLDHFPNKVFALTLHSNQLFGIGANQSIRKWNGSVWTTITYNNPDNDDELYDICSFNNELYLLGNFNNSVALKKLNNTGNWEDVNEISYVSPGKLKVIEDKLYLFGNNVYLNNSNKSEIIAYDGSTWQPVGNIKGTYVSNILKFNGKLLCVIGSLLYSYE